MVPPVSQVPDWSAPEVALEPGSVLECSCFLCTWLLLEWGDPAPPSPRTQGAISDGTQVHGRETPLRCSLLSFLIQNVCVNLVGFVKAILPPVGHTWSTGRDRQVLPGDHILLETGTASVPLGPGAVGEPQTGGSGQGRSYRAVCKCGSPLVSEGPSEGR